MTQEEKQLLLKVLCGMLPYGVNILADIDKEFDGGAIGELVGIIPHSGIEGELLFYQKGCLTPLSIEEIRPYLRSMTTMTDEENKEFWKVVDNYGSDSNAFDDGFELGDDVDWLNEHHFDYRGLIEKGLALEAPEGMYKIKEENE